MAVINARPIVLFLLILTGVGICAPLRAQTLADIAKKEEERRKALPTSAKVYTNKDLTALPAGAMPPPSPAAPSSLAEAAKAAADADKAKDKSNEPAKDQAYWSGRRKTIQDKISRDQTYVEALQTRVNSLSADFVNRDDPAQRKVIEGERQKAVAELGRLQQEIVNGKKSLADLDEEARRAGVPAGWMR
jgi:uncharacterized protein with gpF-like domain